MKKIKKSFRIPSIAVSSYQNIMINAVTIKNAMHFSSFDFRSKFSIFNLFNLFLAVSCELPQKYGLNRFNCFGVFCIQTQQQAKYTYKDQIFFKRGINFIFVTTKRRRT